MVGGVPAGAFEDNPGWGDDLAQLTLVTFGAARQRLVVKRLVTFKLHTTVLTTIRINWHFAFSLLGEG